MFKLLFLLLLYNISYCHSNNHDKNYQEIKLYKYTDIENCYLANYYNYTDYRFYNNCGCLNRNADFNCINDINISNILIENNLTDCIKDFKYSTCYECNNITVRFDYNLFNLSCKIYVFLLIVFILFIFSSVLLFIINLIRKRKYRKVFFYRKYEPI